MLETKETKHCKSCSQDKPVNKDYWYMRKDKPIHPCRLCWRAREAQRYYEDRDKRVEDVRAYRARLRESGEWEERLRRQCAKQREKYNSLSPEERSEITRRKYERCDKERKKQRAAERRKERREEVIAKGRAYRRSRIEQTRESGRRCQQKRRLNPINRVNQSISSAISHQLKAKGLRKRKPKARLTGWTLPELKLHLEPLFEEGMSWENYGEWHIDHIIPLAAFNVSGEDDPLLKSAWSFDNLAPLWAQDNIAKRDSLNWKLPDTYKNPKLRAMYENRNYALVTKDAA